MLEPACGTGQWTRLLAACAESVTAVDAAAEMPALARARTAAACVEFVEADLFAWQQPRRGSGRRPGTSSASQNRRRSDVTQVHRINLRHVETVDAFWRPLLRCASR
ncbi:class I SAM-dependent methyltransferase [Streptomyces coacervatus]|uniref:class I SAM-dependent methyltransferase n=1 Tax=Streptomyces coacervatus TaxID=647381 RepID=UPI0030B81A3A